MYKFLMKNGQVLAFGLGVAIILINVFVIIGGLNAFSALPEARQGETGIFNFGLYAAIALVIVCALAMLAFGLFQVFSNLKGSMKGIIGLVVLVLIIFLGFTLASSDCYGEPLSEGACRWVGGGITSALVLLGLALLALIASEIFKFFK